MNNLKKLRQVGSSDMELFEIKPIAVGGDPIDPANKVWLSRQQHIEAVRYWNNLIYQLRTTQGRKA